jgi:PST family polysaccharide transporter
MNESASTAISPLQDAGSAKRQGPAKLVENIASMFIVQGANYALPLISIPYLVHALGAANYGRMVFAQAFILYFSVTVDYGFGLSATRQVALLKDDRLALSKFISTIIVLQSGFALAGLACIGIITAIAPPFSTDRAMYFLAYLTIAGNIFCPQWLFRGLEMFKQIMKISVITRSLTVVLLFVFVHHPRDLFMAIGIQSAGMAVAAIPAHMVLRKSVRLSPRRPGLHDLKHVLTDGWHAFISNAAISLYTSTNTFVLGLLASPTIVGYYAVANKLVQAATNLITPVSASVFPHIVGLFATSQDHAIKFLRKLFWLQACATLTLSLIIFSFDAPVIILLFGHGMLPAVPLLRIISPLPLLIGLSNIFGIQTMMAFNLKREFSRILVTSGLINIAIIFPLVTYFSATGAAVALLCVEAFVTLAMAATLHRLGILKAITSIPIIALGT